MPLFSLLLCCLLIPLTTSHPMQHPMSRETSYNKGWASYLADEPSQFHNLPLSWSLNTSIPTWLQGSYVKNGPGQRKFGDDRHYSSYLDSWGKLNKFTFNGELVTFSGRMIETANYNRSVNKGEMVPSITLAHVQPNDWNVFEMMEGAVNGFDNTNVMLWKLGPADKDKGIYISVTDFPTVHEMDPDTLAVKQKLGLNELTDGISLGSCAHWRREAGKDSSINFHMIYNPLTLRPDFVLYRFGNNYQVRRNIKNIRI